MTTTSRMAKKNECNATLTKRTAARSTKPAKRTAITAAIRSLV